MPTFARAGKIHFKGTVTPRRGPWVGSIAYTLRYGDHITIDSNGRVAPAQSTADANVAAATRLGLLLQDVPANLAQDVQVEYVPADSNVEQDLPITNASSSLTVALTQAMLGQAFELRSVGTGRIPAISTNSTTNTKIRTVAVGGGYDGIWSVGEPAATLRVTFLDAQSIA